MRLNWGLCWCQQSYVSLGALNNCFSKQQHLHHWKNAECGITHPSMSNGSEKYEFESFTLHLRQNKQVC